jgi:uncharacterized membrane protein
MLTLEINHARLIAIPLAFFAILLLCTFPGWHEDEDAEGSERLVKPFPDRRITYVALAILLLASLFSILSILVQHVASAAASTIVETLSYGTVKGKVGPASMVLGWIGSFFFLITATILSLMISSIQLLSEIFGQEQTT